MRREELILIKNSRNRQIYLIQIKIMKIKREVRIFTEFNVSSDFN